MISRYLTVRYKKFQQNKETKKMDFVGYETESIEFVAETKSLVEGKRKNGQQIIISKLLIVDKVSGQTEINF